MLIITGSTLWPFRRAASEMEQERVLLPSSVFSPPHGCARQRRNDLAEQRQICAVASVTPLRVAARVPLLLIGDSFEELSNIIWVPN